MKAPQLELSWRKEPYPALVEALKSQIISAVMNEQLPGMVWNGFEWVWPKKDRVKK